MENMEEFNSFEIVNVLREQNTREIFICKHARTTSYGVNRSFIQEMLRGPSIQVPYMIVIPLEYIS